MISSRLLELTDDGQHVGSLHKNFRPNQHNVEAPRSIYFFQWIQETSTRTSPDVTVVHDHEGLGRWGRTAHPVRDFVKDVVPEAMRHCLWHVDETIGNSTAIGFLWDGSLWSFLDLRKPSKRRDDAARFWSWPFSHLRLDIKCHCGRPQTEN